MGGRGIDLLTFGPVGLQRHQGKPTVTTPCCLHAEAAAAAPVGRRSRPPCHVGEREDMWPSAVRHRVPSAAPPPREAPLAHARPGTRTVGGRRLVSPPRPSPWPVQSRSRDRVVPSQGLAAERHRRSPRCQRWGEDAGMQEVGMDQPDPDVGDATAGRGPRWGAGAGMQEPPRAASVYRKRMRGETERDEIQKKN